MGRRSLLICGFLIIATLKLFAQNRTSGFEFVENKGQWDSRISYKGEFTSGAFFLEKNGFTVLLHHPDDLMKALRSQHSHTSRGNNNPKDTLIRNNKPGGGAEESLVVRSHSYNVRFENANANVAVTPDKILPTYNNYFIGNDPSKWKTEVKIFQAVLYRDVYPNIDVRYYSENGELKYDIIVRPGGDVNKISLLYTGASKLQLKNKDLLIKTTAGDVKELYPYSYQFDSKTGRKNVSCEYVLDGNRLRFRVGNYSKDATLIIDPTLIFSSFTGSSADQYGFTATPAPDGSFFSGGIVFAQGFPTTPGAYQTIWRGGNRRPTDIGIMKFSPNGSQRLYATYLGGSGNEYPHSLFSDPQGNLVVMGRTYSGDYPGTTEGPTGEADIIVSKFNAGGTQLIGSLRIGGRSNDGVNITDMQIGTAAPVSLMQNYGDDSRSEVILDAQNNIYVAAQSQSNDFPRIGAGAGSTYGGSQDGVLMKIAPNCDRVIWSTYFGGPQNDGAFVLAQNPANGNIYIGGSTESQSLPGDRTGVYRPAYQGGPADGFIAMFTQDGVLLKTTYLGTDNRDIIYGLKFDRAGFPYFMGITRGNWPVVNARYRNAGAKQFVGKIQPDLSDLVFTTTYGNGNKPNMSPVAFLVDRCENMYISGWGGWLGASNDEFDMGGVAGMPITNDAIKSITDNHDFYFIVLKKNADDILYGTFFGQDGGLGEHVDGGTSRYDQQGVIYQAMCANCQGGANFPTSPGVVGPVNLALPEGCNLAAVKIEFDFAGVASGPKAFFNGVADSVGCVPFTVVLRDTVRNAKSYEWNFGDGSPDEVTPNFELSHTFNAVGDYLVRLIAIDSTTCNIRDTAFITVKVRDDIARLNFTATKMPPCESLSYQFTNTSVAPAGKPFNALSFTWDFGDGRRVQSGPGAITHSYSAPGTYNVRLILNDTAYCNAPDSTQTLVLRVAPLVQAQFEMPPIGCAPFEATFTNTSLAGQTFFWDFGDGGTSTDVNPVHFYAAPGSYRVQLIAVDPATCNGRDTTEQVFNVASRPLADFSVAPVPPEVNKPSTFTNLSNGGVQYKWLFGDGDSTIKNTRDTVMHQYNATGTYNACLIVFNEAGCTDTICKPVQAEIIPLLDVPNAFTPGRFGKNSIVRVEGFGIARMAWKIYNRWGQKVFESNDRRNGWDGTFNGKPQPMDVYAYTLEVEFSDGTRAKKTGDITLIR